MIASMTGFGRAEKTFDDSKAVVEIFTVNNRYLDFQIRVPRTLLELEQKIKKLISTKIYRGKVNFSLVIENSTQDIERLSLNTGMADTYFKIFNELKSRFNLSDQISLLHLVNLPDLLTVETSETNLEKIWSDIEPVCIQALDSLCQMRLNEGENLKNDLQKRLKLIAGSLSNIKQATSGNVTAYREKLKQRIAEILDDYPVDEQRLAMETAMAAEKMDITEEIIRLDSHVKSYEQTLEHDGPVGKRLTFVLQEMHREANTIASKALDYKISSLVIDIKDELEKLREQVLNIE